MLFDLLFDNGKLASETWSKKLRESGVNPQFYMNIFFLKDLVNSFNYYDICVQVLNLGYLNAIKKDFRK